MVDASGRKYAALLIDPDTGEIEAYGPVDEPNAVCWPVNFGPRWLVMPSCARSVC